MPWQDFWPYEVTRPKSPQLYPYRIPILRAHTYYHWCSCGRSDTQPWCNGSHVGTGYEPVRFNMREDGNLVKQLCGCKYTSNVPYCNQNHFNVIAHRFPAYHFLRMTPVGFLAGLGMAWFLHP
mmetsp:Transcript_5492/g.13746  ORF Transcript_5492/g.13746 Transcript_5492/m.13746 type:complete len:123 (+) Transcript_5492:92-460(+)|eukprot:g1000.t1